jgi:hypothetical protein
MGGQSVKICAIKKKGVKDVDGRVGYVIELLIKSQSSPERC